MAQYITAGRALIVLGNLAYSVGSFVADYNETHVKNPRWPPHAKFHNGQTMSLGVMLCALSLYYLYRSAKNAALAIDNAFSAALVGSLYCVGGLLAILYPETEWQDPEFPGNGEQRYVFSGIVAVVWLGYLLESRRLSNNKHEGKTN